MAHHSWRRPLILAAAIAIAAAGCGGAGGGQSAAQPSGSGNQGQGKGDGVLKLGYVLPETGDLAFLGPPQIQATKYAIAQINDGGGVLGKPIPDVVGGDEANDASVANQSADRVLASGVDVIIGAAASGMSLAIIDKVTGAHVVQCSGSNTAPTFTDYNDHGYYFRTAPSDALQGPVLADTVISDGNSKVAVVARADDYGRGLADATAKALKEAGASVPVKATYDPKTTNFDALVQKVANAKPDAVVMITFEEGKQILKGLIEAGYGPDKVGVYGADGLRSEQLGKLVSPDNPGIIAGMKGTAPASASNPQFVKSLKKFAPKLKELQYAPQVFDCVNVVALAAEQANTDDPSVFKDEVIAVTKGGEKCDSFAACKKLIDKGKDIDYQGASGPLDFTDAGEPGQAMIEIYGYNKQGKLHTLDTVKSKPL